MKFLFLFSFVIVATVCAAEKEGGGIGSSIQYRQRSHLEPVQPYESRNHEKCTQDEREEIERQLKQAMRELLACNNSGGIDEEDDEDVDEDEGDDDNEIFSTPESTNTETGVTRDNSSAPTPSTGAAKAHEKSKGHSNKAKNHSQKSKGHSKSKGHNKSRSHSKSRNHGKHNSHN